MSNQFLGEIRIVGFNFPPQGWAFCNGQLLPISQNTALFSLLGTQFGGDGSSNFALPNLQGAVPLNQGQGPGLSEYVMGESGGTPNVTLLTFEIPAHTHTLSGQDATPQIPGGPDQAATTQDPTGALLAEPVANPRFTSLYSNAAANSTANPAAVGAYGGSQPHNNMQPYLGMNFVIAMTGVFPPRS